MEINGIAHIQITAGRYDLAREFYGKLLPFLGLKQVMDNDYGYYCVGGRTGVMVSRPAPEHEGERFVQQRVGLHHVCFRARSREDVDEAYAFVKTLGTPILVSEATGRQAEDEFDLREMAPLDVRGRANPERVFELLGPRAA